MMFAIIKSSCLFTLKLQYIVKKVISSLTLLIPGLLAAPQNRGGMIRPPPPPPPPLRNIPISYDFTLKLVKCVHQGLLNK